jgi:hypothetical protein
VALPPLHAELLERRQRNDQTFLYFRIYGDDPLVPDWGKVEVPDGDTQTVKQALRQEAQRLQSLPVGKILDL